MTTNTMRRKRSIIYCVPGSYVFTPNRDDVINSRFRLRYSTTCDTYYRDWSDSINLTSNNVMPGWERGIFAMDSVHRNIDEETGEVYFDRIKHNITGNLKWKFDFSSCGLLVDEVTICFNYLESHGGEITTTIVADDGKKRLRYLNGGEYVTYSELQNSRDVAVVIHFIGDPNQVTKLFPQKIMGGIGYPMDIKISLKAPLESLGVPRVLLGLMYSNAQEIQVDSRHYKETGSVEPCRGFLHVHFHEGKDLPQQKDKILETSAKCYLLPSNKKVKCKSVTRKGKHPAWNEQFLIVGVGFLEIKKQALEFCLVSNLKKKKKFIGGFRLSLGYQKIVAAQTEKANAVISKLFSKPSTNDEDNKNETKAANGTGLKKLTTATENIKRNGIHHAQINGNVSSKTTNSTSTTQEVNPGLDSISAWKIASMDELRTLDFKSVPSSVITSSQQSSLCTSNGVTTDVTCVTSTSTIVSAVKENGSDSFDRAPSLSNVSHTSEMETKRQENVTYAPINENKTTEVSEQSNQSNSKGKTALNGHIKKDEESNDKPWLHREEDDKHSRNSPLRKNKEDASESGSHLKGNAKEIRTIKSSKSCEIPDNDETAITCSAALAHRWNSDRQLKKEEKKSKKISLEQILGEGLDEMALDSVGLEVKQWENVINKPKQWHYCWQILRKDMIPVHHCKS